MEIGITLKFTETNLFLTKMDCTQFLLYFSYLKLNFLLCLGIVIAMKLTCVSSEVPKYNVLFLKKAGGKF